MLQNCYEIIRQRHERNLARQAQVVNLADGHCAREVQVRLPSVGGRVCDEAPRTAMACLSALELCEAGWF